MTDHVDESVIRGLPVPEMARAVLRQGVPREVRLVGRLGPTVFSSGVEEGRLELDGDEVVLGAIRETEGVGEGTPYAEFRLRPDGAVVLADLGPDERVHAVNTTLARFFTALQVFLRWWNHRAGTVEELARVLEEIDPGALDDPEGFWAMWVEELG